jgi:hypothetical protein
MPTARECLPKAWAAIPNLWDSFPEPWDSMLKGWAGFPKAWEGKEQPIPYRNGYGSASPTSAKWNGWQPIAKDSGIRSSSGIKKIRFRRHSRESRRRFSPIASAVFYFLKNLK